MQEPTEKHSEALYCCIHYILATQDQGLVLDPMWEDDKHEIVIQGDSDAPQDPMGGKATLGWIVRVCEATVAESSKNAPMQGLSITEDEMMACIPCVQNMIYAKEFYESLGLTVCLPMQLYCDNRGVKDIVDSWKVAGRTRHLSYKMNWLRELKEEKLLEVIWQAGPDNPADILSKACLGPHLRRHASVFYGVPEAGEGVGIDTDRNTSEALQTVNEVNNRKGNKVDEQVP